MQEPPKVEQLEANAAATVAAPSQPAAQSNPDIPANAPPGYVP